MIVGPTSNNIKKVKLLIFDVDGVLTDGKKAYGIKGEKISKNFGDLDFTAIKVMKSLGFKVIWLSGDEIVNEPVAQQKNIPFYCTRQEDGSNLDKVDYLPRLQKIYSVEREEIWFIGDDIFDLNVIKMVGFSSCPANASFLLKSEVNFVHKGNSGENIASEVLEILLLNHNIKSVDTSLIYEIQNRENRKGKKKLSP